jgi:son of sevenless-like protein
MLETAEGIVHSVHRFLVFAHQAGVELSDDRLPYTVGLDKTPILSPMSSEPPAPYRRREPAKAKSLADLRSGRRPSDAPALPRLANGYSSISSQAIASGLPASPTSSSGSTDEDSPTGPLTPAPVTVRTRADVLRLLEGLHDQLLSTIAAFIGHVHAHSRTQSHPSSHAHLIDMTRETIERVRDLLAFVEAVEVRARSRADISQSDKDLVANSREALYVATTSLVTAARVATSDQPAATFNKEEAEEDDDEKAELLHSATAVLRAGGDCVGAIKLCLVRKDSLVADLFGLQVSDLLASSTSSASSVNRTDVPFPRASADDDEEDVEGLGSWTKPRARHTLSMLGRKATSLSCLRDKYERDGSLSASVFEAVVEAESEADAEADAYDGVGDDNTDSQPSTTPAPSIQSNDSRSPSPPASQHRTSDLSSRRGLRTPTPLRLRGVASAYHGRTASGESTSAASTVTSVGRAAGQLPSPASASGSSDRTRITTVRAPPPSHRVVVATAAAASQPMSREGSRASASTSQSSDRSNLFEEAAPSSPRSSLGESQPADEVPRRAVGKAPVAGVQRPQTSASTSPTSSVRDPATALLARDYDRREVSFNSDGHVTGGTLRCLVERMTLHDTTIDPTFAYTFFLTFRLFTTPLELVDCLVARFDLRPPEAPDDLGADSLKLWHDHKAVPVRLRVYNLIKTWLEAHWRPDSDYQALDALTRFTRDVMAPAMSAPSQRLLDLIRRRQAQPPSPTSKMSEQQVIASSSAAAKSMACVPSSDRLRATEGNVNGPPSPAPVLSKNTLALLRSSPWNSVSVTDIDPLELARQITILESRVYLQITPAELLGGEFAKKATASAAVHVKAMSALSTRLTGWIAETILSEHDTRKRTALLKYFIKLGDVRLFLSCLCCVGTDAEGTPDNSAACRSAISMRSWPSLPLSTRPPLLGCTRRGRVCPPRHATPSSRSVGRPSIPGTMHNLGMP